MGTVHSGDTQTETFSNSKGWTTVRVTHVATGLSVERSKTDSLRSAVQAQRECLEELRRLIDDQPPVADGEAAASPSPSHYERLSARVDELEQRLAALEGRVLDTTP